MLVQKQSPRFARAGAVFYEDFHPAKGLLSNRYTVNGSPALVQANDGFAEQFVSSDSDSLLAQVSLSFKSIIFDLYLESTEVILDFDGGSTYIHNSGGTLTATGFTSPTEYVQGVASDSLTNSIWQRCAVTSATAVTPTHFRFAYNGSTYGDITITNVIAFEDEITAETVALFGSI